MKFRSLFRAKKAEKEGEVRKAEAANDALRDELAKLRKKVLEEVLERARQNG